MQYKSKFNLAGLCRGQQICFSMAGMCRGQKASFPTPFAGTSATKSRFANFLIPKSKPYGDKHKMVANNIYF
jgi:hypothetical protein